MKKQVVLMFLWMTILTGVAYPLLTTGIAQLLMKDKAEGSFIFSKGKKVGSLLIAQKFESPRYFWSRPSANDYNPLASGGSNLGPTNLNLKALVKKRAAIINKIHENISLEQIPSELLYASGSGLDPHLSPKTVEFQFDRVVKARKFDETKRNQLQQIIEKLIVKNKYSFLGAPCLNVLELNIALDELESS